MMFHSFLLHTFLCVFIHIVLGNTELEEFGKFIKQYNKVYKNPKEYQYRLAVFTSNLNTARHLQKEELGTAEYGITQFSDLTDEEFTRNSVMYLGTPPIKIVKQENVEATPVQRSCDWRKAGVISKVKNQLRCGSCWAFASVGNIEAQWGILGHPVNLSVQQVLDCGPCEEGCRGGYFWDAYITVMKEGGLASEEDYPYEGITEHCRSYKKVANIPDFIMLPRNEKIMAYYVMNYGTIAVAINDVLLKHYIRGVIQNANCDPNHLNHAVLIVGYSQDSRGRFWIVKNSWGESWGENGFFRISLGKNTCGISHWPLSANVTYRGSQRINCPT
ncbi:cathepsin W-like [Dendropsophus ebraccatus]|uniref:cathepsin W-like n=1 Tax=Dendropsophus ebraccatus TaxID=150705 RepID=UPI003831117A